jgi:prolyl 4-hydroxylase
MVIIVLLVLIVVLALFRTPRESFANDESMLPYQTLWVPDVLTPEECIGMIRAAEPRLQRSTVNSNDKKVTNVRTSQTAWIKMSESPVARKLVLKAAQLTGVLDPSKYEDVQVARYLPGQEYRPHYDACISKKFCKSGAKKLRRRATLLTYLTDDLEGGETAFPKLDQKVRPVKGSAILFYNTNPEVTEEIEESLHGGLPVLQGTKYIATVWVNA